MSLWLLCGCCYNFTRFDEGLLASNIWSENNMFNRKLFLKFELIKYVVFISVIKFVAIAFDLGALMQFFNLL